MSKSGQGSKHSRKFAENFNRLSRVHESYRRETTDDGQTDGRQHSERLLKTTRLNFTKFSVPVAISRSSAGDNVIRYVVPVL